MYKLSNKLVCVFLITVSFVVFAEDVAITVIANNEIAMNETQTVELQRLYLGRITHMQQKDVKPLDLPENSDVRKNFYRKVLKRSPEQMNRYWSRALFTGTAKPPKIVESETDMKKAVGGENAIGYVSSNKVDETVKTIEILEIN